MPKRNLIWVLALLAVAALTAWLTRPAPAPNDPLWTHFRSVAEAQRVIRENYLHAADEDRLRRGAVEGMVRSLDEFSTYVPPEQAEEFHRRIMGQESGPGLCVSVADGTARVEGVLPDSPACRAGIPAGTEILAIDGKPTAGLSEAQIEKLLQGRPETELKLSLRRPGGRKDVVTLARRKFPVEAVEGLWRDAAGHWVYQIEPGSRLAYFRIREFVRQTGDQFQNAYLHADEPTGVVLDLRGNPGGLLSSGAAVANLFLREGRIVTSVSRGGKKEVHDAHAAGTLPDTPVVVLVDADTASAAEIVAGALKEHGRAVVLGVRTRGKGYIQSVIPLGDDLGLINLTTSEFYLGESQTPITRRAGASRWGVDPHETVSIPAEVSDRLRALRDQARLLVLPETAPTTTTAAAADRQRLRLVREMLSLDAQLNWAVQLLRKPEEMQRLLREAQLQRRREARTRAAAPAATKGSND